MMRFFAFALALAFAPIAANAAACPGNAAWQYNAGGSTQTMAQTDDLTGSGACENKVNLDQLGGKLVVVDPCQGNAHIYAPISATTTTTIAPGTAGKKTYICSIQLSEPVAAPAVGVALVEGTGTNCSVISAGILGGITAATGILGPNTPGFVKGTGLGEVGSTATAGDNICIGPFTSAVQVSGGIDYVQQ